MNIDRLVILSAGAVTLISAALAYWHTTNWLILTGFIGLNLMQAAITGFCPLAMALKKLGITPGPAFK